MVENHLIDDELDILNSGLPEEEVCFESNGTVEKNHATNESNVVTSDNENNKVLLNVVRTHEPVIARVEDNRSPEVRRELFGVKKLRSNSRTRLDECSDKLYHREKSVPSLTAKKTSTKPKAKDQCDKKNGKDVIDDDDSKDPTYVNVFEGICGKAESVPIYENCCVTRSCNGIIDDNKYRKSNHVNKVIKSLAELNSVTDAIVKSATNGNCESDTSSLSNTDCDDDHFKRSYSKDMKLATISENRLSKRNVRDRESAEKIKPNKTRSKKMVVRSPSSTSSIESINCRNSANENACKDSDKPLHAKSTRSSRLHRATNGHESSSKETIDRYSSNEKKKSTNERTTSVNAKPRANHSVNSSTATETKKSLTDTTR